MNPSRIVLVEQPSGFSGWFFVFCNKLYPMTQKTTFTIIFILLSGLFLTAQQFPYQIQIEPVEFESLPGLHSYAIGQADGKWLLIGGRRDGIHARQPFNAFPEVHNNDEIYVVDVATQQWWSAPLDLLPQGINAQLQSTNMNFFQDADTLYIIGGYAYSQPDGVWKTFPALTSVLVSSTINAIMQGADLNPFFRQLSHDLFAVTGGYLGKIDDRFYLVGGHRFDGRYNPMGGPSYTQQYTNQIRIFSFNNSESGLSFEHLESWNDPVHLRRRDYNLLPQIFPDGSEGYTISAGVFQIGVDLPFLYPVDISTSGYSPRPEFSQYLSHYHSAKVSLYDSIAQTNHSIFFGGMSQFYYLNGQLTEDNQVPFVSTVSLLSRNAGNQLEEFVLPLNMSGFKGSGAEFIIHPDIPHLASELVMLHQIQSDTVLLGHIFGGIHSPAPNPFANNQTGTTYADNSIFAVYLMKDTPTSIYPITGNTPHRVKIHPNPAQHQITVSIAGKSPHKVRLIASDLNGRILSKQMLKTVQSNYQELHIPLDFISQQQLILVNIIIDDRYYFQEKLLAVP